MDLGLTDKKALVTGFTAGIGLAAARGLARHYAAGMRSRNGGRIVFVSSESALQIPLR